MNDILHVILRACFVWGLLTARSPSIHAQPPPRPYPDQSPIAPLAEESGDAVWFQGTTLEAREEARQLLLEGNALMRQARFSSAAESYHRALEIWDHPALHYNLAIAQINLVQPVAAFHNLEAGTKHGPAPLGQEAYKNARRYMVSLRQQLGRVIIECQQTDIAIILDGSPLPTRPGLARHEILVVPGTHRLVASKSGFETKSLKVEGKAGEDTVIPVRLRLPPRLIAIRRWPAWKLQLLMGVGVVSLIGAGTLDDLSSRTFDAYDQQFTERCPAGCRPSELPVEVKSLPGHAKMEQWGARVLYGVAASALISGSVLLYLNRARYREMPGRYEDSDLSLAPRLTPRSVGVSARFRF